MVGGGRVLHRLNDDKDFSFGGRWNARITTTVHSTMATRPKNKPGRVMMPSPKHGLPGSTSASAQNPAILLCCSCRTVHRIIHITRLLKNIKSCRSQKKFGCDLMYRKTRKRLQKKNSPVISPIARPWMIAWVTCWLH